ncbi:MAG: DNA polymerase III subunit delta [Clostridia bacterium]|nr:DNA polymerase III subunit delta [Clostridia bacterium]
MVNAVISEADYRKQIGKTAGKAYLFFGEEDYLKAHAVKQTRAAICEDAAFAVFNDITIDAADYTPDGLLNAMSPPPMMSEGRLIVLRGLDFTSMKPTDLDALLETLAILPEYDYNTVLIYVAAGLVDEGYLPKRPSAIFKKLSEVLIPVRFEASTPARLAAWAGKHFAHLGVQASPAACGFLVSYVGESMFRLAAEIEKLAYYVLAAGRSSVSEEDIRLVTVPQPQTDAFALSNAILAGKYKEALEALAVMKFERIEPTMVLGELAKTLCDMYATRLFLDAGRSQKEIAAALKLHEYKTGLIVRAVSRTTLSRLSRAVALCAEADMALKSSYADYTPIEKLICSL